MVEAAGPDLFPLFGSVPTSVPATEGSLLAALRRTRSASLATGSAAAFLLLATLLSFVPEAPPGEGFAWQLRGSLVPVDGAPAPGRWLGARAAS